MSQSIITNAFSPWLVARLAENAPARPDKMVFAYIAGQDENAEIDPDEQQPAAAQIVHVADITQFGTINERAFVCSVILDTTIGNWRYNWIGLVDSESDTLLMIVHTAEQQKIKTASGAQGNTLTRNLMMEFSGAAAAAQITVTAETWQIDFSARLHSMDEARRLANVDYYGEAAFRGEGFRVTVDGAAASVAPGLGYVAGLRAFLAEPQALAVVAPTGIWVDICWSGTVTGAWANSFTLRAANALEDYVDAAGFPHFVTRIATIDDAAVTDERKPFPLDALQHTIDTLNVYSKIESDLRYFQRDNNLSEIAAAGDEAQAAARDNISVYSVAAVDEMIAKLAARCPHDVGDVIFRDNHTDPNTQWPDTKWMDLSAEHGGRSIQLGALPMTTGGQNEISLSESHLPAHKHSFSGQTEGAGRHAHTYNQYTIDTAGNRHSLDDRNFGQKEMPTSEAPDHAHTFSGITESTGDGKAFSVVSAFLQLRGWRRLE